MFNQVADDRDHMSMRMPGMDNFYGRGYERPVYFCSGLPQQRGKFMNNTKGVASTAGKFASSFALGFKVFGNYNEDYARMLFDKALQHTQWALNNRETVRQLRLNHPISMPKTIMWMIWN